MKCPTCGEEMVLDYGDAKLLDDEYDYSKKIALMRCAQCGTIMIGDNVIKPKEKMADLPKEVPAEAPADAESPQESLPAVVPGAPIPEEASFSVEPECIQEEIFYEEEPAQPQKRAPMISIKEFQTTGHLLSDAWLDTLELSDNVFKKQLYDYLVSFERKQQRHMARYIPTKLVVIHDTIINPAICELIKTEEIRIHKQFISKRYYFKSPEGYFFSIAHTMKGVDQATELKLSQVKALFDQDADLYKKYVPENTYKEGYNPLTDGPLNDDSPDESEESLEAMPAPPKSESESPESRSSESGTSEDKEPDKVESTADKKQVPEKSPDTESKKGNKKPEKKAKKDDTGKKEGESNKKSEEKSPSDGGNEKKASKQQKKKNAAAAGKGNDSEKDDNLNKAKENEPHQKVSEKGAHEDYSEEIPDDADICSSVDDYELDFPDEGR